jgi:glyoxylase-like metal-dependent hydrolase (beta-lactamase superfamily II)
MKAFWTLAMLAAIAMAATDASAAARASAASPPSADPPLFHPWINGVSAAEPQMQVQSYDADTFVIRQSIRTNFEGPFLYLLFGHDRAILLDSGAGGLKIRPTVEQVIAEWLAHHGRTSIPLVIAHSHSHGDHHQGDVEFEQRPDTTVVGLYTTEVSSFFKISDWPNDIARYDLGGRILDIIPTPGHHASHIMVYDEKTRLLLSGDTLCACRLYIPVNQFASFRDSIDRVAAFAKDHPISHILGAHIEMTHEPGELIIDEAPSHPDEHVLELPPSALTELKTSVHAMGDTPKEEPHRDFVIFPLPPRPLPPASPPPK